jgi:hypothetical protein
MQDLQKISPEMKKKFLLFFTRELIRNSETQEIKEWKIKIQEEVKKHPEIKEEKQIMGKVPLSPFKKLPFKPRRLIQRRAIPSVLKIPGTRLPPHLQNITPIPKSYSISLGKLDPLMNNPSIRVIECNGPDQNITIRAPQTKQTEIILTKEEIDSILNGFSVTSGIPLEQGINNIVVGNLELSAIVSEVIGSKFIIKKITNLQGRIR